MLPAIGCCRGIAGPFDFLGRLGRLTAGHPAPSGTEALDLGDANQLNSGFAERVPGTSAVATRGEGGDSSPPTALPAARMAACRVVTAGYPTAPGTSGSNTPDGSVDQFVIACNSERWHEIRHCSPGLPAIASNDLRTDGANGVVVNRFRHIPKSIRTPTSASHDEVAPRLVAQPKRKRSGALSGSIENPQQHWKTGFSAGRRYDGKLYPPPHRCLGPKRTH